jgi:hypothetical protein
MHSFAETLPLSHTTLLLCIIFTLQVYVFYYKLAPPLRSLWSSNDAQSFVVTKHPNMRTLCFFLVWVCKNVESHPLSHIALLLVYYIDFSSLFYIINWPHHWGLFNLTMMHKVLLSTNAPICAPCVFFLFVCVYDQKQGNTHIFYKQLYYLLHLWHI